MKTLTIKEAQLQGYAYFAPESLFINGEGAVFNISNNDDIHQAKKIAEMSNYKGKFQLCESSPIPVKEAEDKITLFFTERMEQSQYDFLKNDYGAFYDLFFKGSEKEIKALAEKIHENTKACFMPIDGIELDIFN